jgi:hypothetical protein
MTKILAPIEVKILFGCLSEAEDSQKDCNGKREIAPKKK